MIRLNRNPGRGSCKGYFSDKIGLLLTVILIAATTIFGCQSRSGTEQPGTGFYYTCSMHPQIHKDGPGDCPICGMKLIKVEATSGDDEMLPDSSLEYLTKPVTETVVGSFKVISPVRIGPEDTIRAVGVIGFDERDINTVNSRVTGRIEKLYVKYGGQPIHKGQPLMTIYSPELVNAQRDLLQAEKDNDLTLMTTLKKNLLNLGMNENELEKLLGSRKSLTNITIYSPYNGISRPTNINDVGSDKKVLLNIKEGIYVNKGQTVFAIQNTNDTWAILNIFTEDIGNIKAGDPVSIYADASPENKIRGRIDFIPPYQMGDVKANRVRVYLNKVPKNWKIGMLIRGLISVNNESKGWFIPISAVNDLGMHHVIWVQDKKNAHIFHAKNVDIGLTLGDSVEVISGIHPEDKIVTNAAYMVGSDSFIQ